MLLCLMLFAACSTSQVVVKPVKAPPDPVPAPLLIPCVEPLKKPATSTGVIVERMQHAEAGLLECGEQILGVRRWDNGRHQ